MQSMRLRQAEVADDARKEEDRIYSNTETSTWETLMIEESIMQKVRYVLETCDETISQQTDADDMETYVVLESKR